MKKLILLLALSLGLTSVSYAERIERIICSYEHKYGTDLIEWSRYRHTDDPNDKRWIFNGRLPVWETSYESEFYIVLNRYYSSSLLTAYIDKKTMRLIYTEIIVEDEVSYGQCKFVY